MDLSWYDCIKDWKFYFKLGFGLFFLAVLLYGLLSPLINGITVTDQQKRERTDVVNNIQICLKIIKLDENNFDFNMQLYVNLNTWKILVNNNTYFYNTKILIKVNFNKFYFIFHLF